jgi:hypothetical protein
MRRMVVVASVLSIMVLVVTIGSALALDCHGRVVVIEVGLAEVNRGPESGKPLQAAVPGGGRGRAIS